MPATLVNRACRRPPATGESWRWVIHHLGFWSGFTVLDAPLRSGVDGFRSQSDFSRAFRDAYGLAPSTWDRVSPLVATVDGPDREGPGRFGQPDPPIEVEVRRHPQTRRLRQDAGSFSREHPGNGLSPSDQLARRLRGRLEVEATVRDQLGQLRRHTTKPRLLASDWGWRSTRSTEVTWSR